MDVALKELLKQMPRCKDCKYFEPDPHDKGWGMCVKAESDAGVPTHVDTMAVAEDCEAFNAYLKVRENFGCVMFRPKR